MGQTMNYMKQLDSLRAIAVLLVLYAHFFEDMIGPFPFGDKVIGVGGYGVDLFFVLSGFLITGILLISKDEIDNGSKTVASSAKTFYIRRILRIFPIYYLILLIAFILAIHPVRETILWHTFYLSNFYIAQQGRWVETIGHLWSLSVEEQFYLIWPWIILFTPRKRLLMVLIALTAVGPLYRLACLMNHVPYMTSRVMTLGCMDFFGIGALLAYIKKHNNTRYTASEFSKHCLLIGGVLFPLAILLGLLGIKNPVGIFAKTCEGMFFCWLIYKASEKFDGVIGMILETKILIYIGKISYGIYLYHNFIPHIIPAKFLNYYTHYVVHPLGVRILYVILTIAIASLSWYLVEKPMNTLKKRFE